MAVRDRRSPRERLLLTCQYLGLTADGLFERVIDALDAAVLACSPDLGRVEPLNAGARALIAGGVPDALLECARDLLAKRRALGHPPRASRLELAGGTYYVRLVHSPGTPPLELLFVREEVARDPDGFRILNGEHGVSRREYQILTRIRLGKTNRAIALELGLKEGTVAGYVHKLLERFEAPNRTGLIQIIDRILADRR